jgi:hypothetical protein
MLPEEVGGSRICNGVRPFATPPAQISGENGRLSRGTAIARVTYRADPLRRYLILVAIALALMSFPTRASLFKKPVQAKFAAVSPPAATAARVR